jgi:1-deoxy-D-xylulose-5-phosphate reductoisomerase
MRNLTILGSTGSVGVNTLDVVARHPEKFNIVALTARSHVDLLFEQARRFRPKLLVMEEPGAAAELARRAEGVLPGCIVRSGAEGLEHAASLPEVDTVMAAIVGIAGLRPTLAAARSGKKVLTEAMRQSGAVLLPIDSEHNAIFQALPRGQHSSLAEAGVRRLVLTASGGPFRRTPLERLGEVTPDEACAHPNWVMGRKISVDSATMMNKGLEVIEAHWLFGVGPSQIEVVIHPESVVHSLVEYVDGSMIAQLSNPDMRTPIAYALGFPERITAGVEFLDLARIGALHFEPPDPCRFPCLALAYEALRAGGSAPAVLNAANEIAVEHFLRGALKFTDIPVLIDAVMNAVATRPVGSIEDVLDADANSRACALRWLRNQRGAPVSEYAQSMRP